MNLPLELVNVLNWRDKEEDKQKFIVLDENRETTINKHLGVMYPVFNYMVQFGIDYHSFMDNNDVEGLHQFIQKYQDDSYWRIASFVKGLIMDIEAVQNTLLYPHISNGIVEGTNSIIKSVKRVCGGRAKIDLLTAKMVLRQKVKPDRVRINA